LEFVLDNSESTRIISLNDNLSDISTNKPCLIVIAGSNIGKMYKIEKEEELLGRMDNNHIVINDEGISRTHCRLIKLPGNEVMLEDLNSTNGTYVNSQKVARSLLKDGDKIQVGSTTILKFTYSDKLEENFQRQTKSQVQRDGLTGLFNRKALDEILPKTIDLVKTSGVPLTVFMMDIDHFKHFNDTYGHQMGDKVLKLVGET